MARGKALTEPSSEALLTARIAQLLEFKTLKSYEIPIDDIDPAAINPNQMTAAEVEATRQSLLLYGVVKPGMVRPYDESDREEMVNFGLIAWLTAEALASILNPMHTPPSKKLHAAAVKELETWFIAQLGKRWEMLDAHHRREVWLGWIRDGLPDNAHPTLASLVARRVLPCTIHPMSRFVARHLRLILTWDRGTPQEIPAGVIAHELLQHMPMETLLKGLPWTEQQAQNFVGAATFDWQAHLAQQAAENKLKDQQKLQRPAEFKIILTGPEAQREAALLAVNALVVTHPGIKVKP